MKSKERLRVRIRFISFYSELALKIHDVTCFNRYMDRKIWGWNARRTTSYNQTTKSRRQSWDFPEKKIWIWFDADLIVEGFVFWFKSREVNLEWALSLFLWWFIIIIIIIDFWEFYSNFR